MFCTCLINNGQFKRTSERLKCITSVNRAYVQLYLGISDAARIQYYTYNTDYLIRLIFN